MTTILPAALLAAGEGRRLGGPKALLDVGGETLLGRVAHRCREAGFQPLVAVVPPALRDEVTTRLPDLDTVLVNPKPESGPLGSFHLALDTLDHQVPGVLMVMADFVGVRTETYRALATAIESDPSRLWRPVCQDRHGHPVWFPSALFEALRSAPPDQGARAVVYANQPLWGTVEVDDPWIHRDLDTPEDLDRFRTQGSV